jgi:hypothetical protein
MTDFSSLIALGIILAVVVVAWLRPTETDERVVVPPRVVVEELDAEGHVTRRVVL